MKRLDNIEFKFIEGTGNAYSCDREGNIYSHHIGTYGKVSSTPIRKLTPCCSSTSNYLRVTFCLDGKTQSQSVSRLVAQTWVPNPDNLPEVDHIDNNIYNNKAENLQWIDRKGNIAKQTVNKGTLNGLRSHAVLYNPDGIKIGEFSSITAACNYASENFQCSKSGLQKYHKSKGYYIIADNEELRKKTSQKKKAYWDLYNPENVFIGTFYNKTDAARYIKENIRDISIKRFSETGKAYGYYVIQKGVETN